MAAPVQTSMMSPVLISMLRCTPANQVLITPFDLFSWGGRIRTCECRYQKPMAYHLPTPQNVRLAGALGLEPRTFGTRTHCATNCAIPQNAKNLGVAHVRGSLRAVSGQCTSPCRPEYIRAGYVCCCCWRAIAIPGVAALRQQVKDAPGVSNLPVQKKGPQRSDSTSF